MCESVPEKIKDFLLRHIFRTADETEIAPDRDKGFPVDICEIPCIVRIDLHDSVHFVNSIHLRDEDSIIFRIPLKYPMAKMRPSAARCQRRSVPAEEIFRSESFSLLPSLVIEMKKLFLVFSLYRIRFYRDRNAAAE